MLIFYHDTQQFNIEKPGYIHRLNRDAGVEFLWKVTGKQMHHFCLNRACSENAVKQAQGQQNGDQSGDWYLKGLFDNFAVLNYPGVNISSGSPASYEPEHRNVKSGINLQRSEKSVYWA